MWLIVSCCIIYIILRLLQISGVNNLRLTWHAFWIWILAIRADIHVVVIIFLFEGWPSFLSNQRVIVLVFRIVLEKGLGCRWLWLIVVSTNVSTDVFALVEIWIVKVFLHSIVSHFNRWAHDDTSPTRLIWIVEYVSISNILCMNTSPTLNHWKLLRIQILIRIGCKSSSNRLLLKLFVITSSC